MGLGPQTANLLTLFWGVDDFCYGWPPGIPQAANMVFGSNPPYQASDFLALYPKFGTYVQSIASYSLSGTTAGYAVNDTLVPVQPDSSGAVITVTAVGAGGAITGSQLTLVGKGYSAANGLITTTSGAGTGALVNILTIAAGNLLLPNAVLQLYLNLASACLQSARWLDMWQMAMGLFVAHFCTLYLLSDGNPGTTPGTIAQSGLARGIAVSKAAGDVSVGYETVAKDLEGWASWNRTEYGQQLATFGKIVGMGPMYIP